ncbi:sigma-70 family RNA polymerase sigma factor [Arsukibacterium indicum]|uniref:Sigma-70 family RNA polymerase sigma factor n=1 Tax=Arsukibacterium indicum TaxID=2848612 RepID=A0ABS6MFP7_9GAMM|nr:sigma-70 family RNA polymerase sigma factor [Arsukibacterium indicum]MBV2127647.1 sigma-70 family RNA polymerase sigma factor [Arsukibacterium indicum]
MLETTALSGHHAGSTKQKRINQRMTIETDNEQRTGQWEDALTLVALHQDKAAYAELFSYFAPRLRAFGIKMFGNEQQAMEMVQDAMLNVWRKARLFDASRGCASTWIFTIARNVRFDMLRKKQSRKDDISADDLWFDGDYPEQESNNSDNWDTILMSEKLAPHFDGLPPAQRMVMQKVYLEEKSHQEVSDELAIPLGTVKSRIRLALDRLREALDDTRS